MQKHGPAVLSALVLRGRELALLGRDQLELEAEQHEGDPFAFSLLIDLDSPLPSVLAKQGIIGLADIGDLESEIVRASCSDPANAFASQGEAR